MGATTTDSGVLSQVLTIVAEINEVLDLDTLLPRIAASLRRIVDYKFLDIFLAQPDGTLAPALVEGYPAELARHFRPRPGDGIVGAAASSKEVIFVPDVSRDPRYITMVPGVTSELAIPLIHGDVVVGVLNVEGPDAAAFTPEAIAGLRVLASHLAIAIDNAKLYRESRFFANLLKNLHDIGTETGSILDVDTLLTRLAEIVKRMIDYDSFGIALFDEARGELILRKAVCFGPIKEKSRIPIGRGLTGAAVATKQPVLVGDVRRDPRYVDAVPGTRSELVVPLIHKDRVVGVFDLESPHVDRFTQEHVSVLMPLASQVAAVVENARLVEELRRNDQRLSRELAIAQRVQNGLFPEATPQGEGWETAAEFLPARELGGDLYDFYDLGEGRLGLTVGDVAGKGVAAALYGAFVSGTVRARAFERLAPVDLLARVNRTLRRRGMDGLFCTLTYAIVDFPARRLRLANAGAPYPLHYRAATGVCEPIALGGWPLGAFDAAEYEEVVVTLAPGDLLLFHSDGLSEAHNRHEEYGEARLRAIVEKQAKLAASSLVDAIVSDVKRFQGPAPFGDDVAFVVVRLLP